MQPNPYHGAFLIAAPTSNSGKTTLTLGLMKALMNRGLTVQPFKCGPDYIDPMHHRQVAGCDSYNLDVWMSSEAHVTQLFHTQSAKANISIVEGVMGLFDGAVKDNGSPAQLAMLLDIPVVLVVDGKAMAYSAAPLLYGFKHFNRNIRVAGVIFNKVSGDNHYEYLKEAAIDAGVTPLGYLKKNENLSLASRHLGLSMPHENSMNAIVDEMATMIEQSIDMDALLDAVACSAVPNEIKKHQATASFKIAIAKDEAFNFMYPANVDALAKLGDITFFSPLNDTHLPDADLVWLPGGYPELFAETLSANHAMLDAIRQHIHRNKALIAECGGFMYLGKSLEKEGTHYPMAGIFDYHSSLNQMKLTLGYRTIMIDGKTFKGHEFHYSTANISETQSIAQTTTAKGQPVDMPVLRTQNCLASYMHFYCGEVEKMQSLINLLR